MHRANFIRSYNYGDFTTNHLKDFTYGGNSYGYEYDPCGNMTNEASNRYYQWGHNDKLATFSNQSGSGQPTVFANYFYNSAGERVQKQVRKSSRIEVTFYMDGGLFETTYIKPTGGSIDNNRFYNTLNIQDGTSRIATLRIGNDADDPTPAIKFYLQDQVMNSTVVLKDNGTLINREEYYPFGETSFGGFAKKRYRFNRKEKDEESGLYYYGQRYYAPWTCRFISVDPLAADYPFYTSYNYAGNKPVTKVDLEGLQEAEGNPFVQFKGIENNKLKTQIFTNQYNYRNQNRLTAKLLKSELIPPRFNSKLSSEVNRYDIAGKITGGLSDDAFIGVSPIGGVLIAIADIYVQVQKYNAQKSLNEFKMSYQHTIDKITAVNLSIETGKWIMRSFDIASESGVFAGTAAESLSDNFKIDVANYALMLQANQEGLIREQKYVAKPTTMNSATYRKHLIEAFNVLIKDINIDRHESQPKTETGVLGDVQVYSFNVPQKVRKYESQPVEPKKNYIPK